MFFCTCTVKSHCCQTNGCGWSIASVVPLSFQSSHLLYSTLYGGFQWSCMWGGVDIGVNIFKTAKPCLVKNVEVLKLTPVVCISGKCLCSCRHKELWRFCVANVKIVVLKQKTECCMEMMLIISCRTWFWYKRKHC